jgi:predicted enzyme related to lactoylglutathione lyase
VINRAPKLPTWTARAGSRRDRQAASVFFTCDDIQETSRELSERGVTFSTPPTEMEFGWWAIFEDHEGTRDALSER